MRLTAAALLGVGALAGLLLWTTGAFQSLGWWLMTQQHAMQSLLAERIQALRAGEPAAFWSLVALCAGYGVLHAVGPGHGKALIAGAAVGSRATAWRMAVIAVLGSLAQAALAIVIVYGGFLAFGLTARGTVDAAERWIAPFGTVLIALIGAFILARGLRALLVRPGPVHDTGSGNACGHKHGPSAAEVERASGLGAMLALIGAMAARPCTGALFLLVIAWRMELKLAGAAAVFAMGLGTAAFTAAVALLAVSGRESAQTAAGSGRLARLVAPGLQIAAGGAILLASSALLLAELRA